MHIHGWNLADSGSETWNSMPSWRRNPKLDSDKLPRQSGTALVIGQCAFGLISIRHFGNLAPPGDGVISQLGSVSTQLICISSPGQRDYLDKKVTRCPGPTVGILVLVIHVLQVPEWIPWDIEIALSDRTGELAGLRRSRVSHRGWHPHFPCREMLDLCLSGIITATSKMM